MKNFWLTIKERFAQWRTWRPDWHLPVNKWPETAFDWRRFWRVTAPNLAGFVLGIVVILMYLRPWAPVQVVTITTETSDGKQLLKKMDLNHGAPLWRLQGQRAFLKDTMLHRFETVDAVDISATDKGIHLAITDKVTAGYLQLDKQWYALNRHGRLDEKVATPGFNAPVYTDFKAADAPIYRTIAQQFATLEVAIRTNISQIQLSPTKANPKRVVINMNDGNTVYATYTSFAKKLAYYPNIAAQMKQKGVVDLQFAAFSYAYGTQQANDAAQAELQKEAKAAEDAKKAAAKASSQTSSQTSSTSTSKTQ